MFITEIELREMWHNGREALPAFPPGTRFSPAAQDFIKDHRLELRFADPTPEPLPVPQLPVANYDLPAALDTLHALTLLTAAEARRCNLPALAARLDALAAASLSPLPPVPSTPQLPITDYQLPFSPGSADHAIMHWLNLLRATARQAAIQASASGNAPLAAGLGQVSATAANLARKMQSGELGWNALGR